MTQPTLTREGINAALFALLQTVPGITTFTRVWKNFDQFAPAEQPVLILATGNPRPTQDEDGAPTRWKYEFVVYLYAYAQSSNNSVAPSTIINNLMDAIEAVLKPMAINGPPGWPGKVQVLGDLTGRIRHAWISDTVLTDEGVLGPQSIAVFPIEVEFV